MAASLLLALLVASSDALRLSASVEEEATNNTQSTYPAVQRLGQKIRNAQCSSEGDAWTKHCEFDRQGCDLEAAGESWGTHAICSNLISKNKCGFLSYGISSDYSFDKKLDKFYGCEGIALDPTVSYGEKLPETNVVFKKVGAPMLMIVGQSRTHPFDTMAPTMTHKDLKNKLTLLKMDCEGCEYALANDIMNDDPKFLHGIDQFVLEAHVDNRFMTSVDHLKQYDKLLALIEDAGLELMDARFTGCGEDMEFRTHPFPRPPLLGPIRKSTMVQQMIHEKCLPELTATGYECSLNCQNFLFARPDKKMKKK